MTDLFLRLFNSGISAGWIVVAILLVRLTFRKMPRWGFCLLWSVVALRLLLPFSPESTLSLIPSAAVIPQNITTAETPAIYSGIPAVNRVVNPLFATVLTPDAFPLQQILFWASVVWLTGTSLILAYGLISYLRLCRQVRVSIRKEGNLYLCDEISSPFLLGLLRPRIYIPSDIDAQLLPHILAHEQAHIRRRDHWWKPVGFLLLSVYWFNPLLWVGYILLCRDIERACDEKVIAQKDSFFRRDYMDALLACSLHRRMILACPIAFGEISVKSRIKGIARYKKPSFWVLTASSLILSVITICFLTSPKACAHDYIPDITQPATCTHDGLQTNTCRLCDHTYVQSVPCIAHTYDEGRIPRDATCALVGVRIRHCTGCKQKVVEEIPLTAHTPGALTVTKEPNCTQSGAVCATCTYCHVTYITQVLEPNDDHQMERTVIKPATCTEPGEAEDTCALCGHRERKALELADHDYKSLPWTEPTCGTAGKTVRQCTVCKHKVTTVLPPTGNHAYFGTSQNCFRCGSSKNAGSSEEKERPRELVSTIPRQ